MLCVKYFWLFSQVRVLLPPSDLGNAVCPALNIEMDERFAYCL